MKKIIQSKSQKVESFGFWLTLFGLIIFFTPIFIFLSMISKIKSLNNLEIFFNSLIIIGYIWLNYLMVKRKKTFKQWFLGLGFVQIILLGLIAIFVSSSCLYSSLERHNANIDVFRTIFFVIIWSLYLWNSKKVKNVFIN